MLEAVPINWGLIKNPFNWIIVFLMVFIAGLGAHAFTALLSNETKGA